jgi:Fe-S-cluster-containing dehydrogenase component/DMSO reductase anchor subunit
MKSDLDASVNLIDQLIAEQQSLTAVERFAQKHERSEFHAQARHYEDLIPLSKPQKGEQYAFAVDLDRCTGCKACVTACHSLNGLEENETWRDTGLIVGGFQEESYHQTVTTACHHCLEPGCLEGCPVQAYDKDGETGIVRHLDDQCIGCQYCTMKCPYDVPKYSKRLGIVRKCDMCHSRLAIGEAPACVQACPHEAITIRIADRAEVRAGVATGSRMIPGAYVSSYTKPTTLYISDKKIPSDAHAVDRHSLHLEHAHWPLLIMLVFSQCAVGLSVTLALIPTSSDLFPSLALPISVLSFGLLNIGLVAAVFHLGRPLGAWRFFLGLRTSWMSREILTFSLYAGASSTVVALLLSQNPMIQQRIPVSIASLISKLPLPLITEGAILGSALLGVLAVFTSAMIYIDTHRSLWRPSQTLPRFYGATLGLGFSAAAWISTMCHSNTKLFLGLTLITGVVSFLLEKRNLNQSRGESHHRDHLSAQTMQQFLPWYQGTQTGLFALWTTLALIGLLFHPTMLLVLGIFLIRFGFQITERYHYFTCVIPYRMPRGIS